MNLRHKNGQFSEGNSGGPGRPPRRVEAEYLKVTMRTCSLEDWAAIVKRAVLDAKKGDGRARDWLGKYLLGNAAVKAPSPFQVVVNEEADLDPVGEEVARKQLFGLRLVK
jgi:hypothetical protein